MTVYELIQQLANYDPDKEVQFKLVSDFDTYVDATFDRENEEDVQEVKVTVCFDDNLDFDYIDSGVYGREKDKVFINLEY